jgi:molybdopterin synthase sulfur carrier subunit
MIKILLFAQLQEEIGVKDFEIEVRETTVQQLKELLKVKFKFPNLDNVMVAINEEYAMEQDVIHSGDTVALIPPVSGG